MAISQGFSRSGSLDGVDETVSSSTPSFNRTPPPGAASNAREAIESEKQRRAMDAFRRASLTLLDAGESLSKTGESLTEKEPVKEAQEAAITTFSGAFAPFVAAIDKMTNISEAPKKVFASLSEKFTDLRNRIVGSEDRPDTDLKDEKEDDSSKVIGRKIDEEIKVQKDHFGKVESHQIGVFEGLEDAFSQALERNLRKPSRTWDASFDSLDNIWKFMVERDKQKFFLDATQKSDEARFQEELLEKQDQVIDVLERSNSEEPGGGGGLLAALGVGIAATAAFLKKRVVTGIFMPLGKHILKGVVSGFRVLKGSEFVAKVGGVAKKVLKSGFTKVFAALFSIRAIFSAVDEVTNMSDEAISKAGGFVPALIQKFAEALIGPKMLSTLQAGFGLIADPIFKMVDGLIEWVREFFEGPSFDPLEVLKGAFQAFVSLRTAVRNALNDYVLQPLIGGVITFFEPFKNVWNKFTDQVSLWITNGIESLSEKLKSMSESTFGWLDEKLKPFRNFRDAIVGFFTDLMDNPVMQFFKSSQQKATVQRLEEQGFISDRLLGKDTADFSKLSKAVAEGSINQQDLEAVKSQLNLDEVDIKRIDELIETINRIKSPQASVAQSRERLESIKQRDQSEAFSQSVASGYKQASEAATKNVTNQTNQTQVVTVQGASRLSPPSDPNLQHAIQAPFHHF